MNCGQCHQPTGRGPRALFCTHCLLERNKVYSKRYAQQFKSPFKEVGQDAAHLVNARGVKAGKTPFDPTPSKNSKREWGAWGTRT